MKYKIDVVEEEKRFKQFLKEDMVLDHLLFIARYNDLVEAFNEIFTETRNQKSAIDGIHNSIDSINSVLRRIGLPDRIKEIYQIGTVVSNALWKINNVYQARSLPEVQIEGQPGDL